MEYKSNEIKAGIMVFVGLAILVMFLIAIFSVDFGEESKEYTTFLAYVGGVSKGSLVKYVGMDVGSVTEINFPTAAQPKIEVKFNVSQDTPVRVDSRAFITSIGIMADPHLEISAGSLDADLLPGDNVLPSKEVLSFTQMAQPMGEITTQLRDLLASVSDIFGEDNRSNLGSIVKNLDKLVAEGGEQVLKLGSNFETLSQHLLSVTQDFEELMNNNKGNFEQTIANLESTTKETSELISELRETLTMLSSNSSNIIGIMENFQFASQNFEEFTRMVKERPWLLIRKDAPPKRNMP